MSKRVLLGLIAALTLSAAIAAPGAAQDFFKRPRHWPKPVPAPEFDSKLLIGGLAVTAGSVALLIEQRLRRRADDSPDEG